MLNPGHRCVLLKTFVKGWNITKDLSVTISHWSFQCQRVGLKLRFHMGTLRLTRGGSRPSDKGGRGGGGLPKKKFFGTSGHILDPPLLTHALLNHGKLKYFPSLPRLPI